MEPTNQEEKQCEAGPYTRFRDVAENTSAITGGSVTIGIKPILLE